MKTYFVLLTAVIATVFSLSGCAGYHIRKKEGGAFIGIQAGPWYVSIDVAAGKTTVLREGYWTEQAHGDREYWYCPDRTTIEAKSLHGAVVGRYSIPQFEGKEVQSISIKGQVSRDDLYLSISLKDPAAHYTCLFNTATGQVSRLDCGGDLTAWSYGSNYFAGTQRTGDRQDVILFDRAQGKVTNITNALRKDNAEKQSADFCNPHFVPASSLLLFTENFTTAQGYWFRIYLFDIKTQEIKEVRSEKEGFRGEGNILIRFAPDGKRTALGKGNAICILDLSTGVMAGIPDVEATGLVDWSPSGEYVAYTWLSFWSRRLSAPYEWRTHSEYAADVVRGGWGRMDDDDDFMESPDAWLAPAASEREVNIAYAEWLASLIKRGIEKDKVVKRLAEFTGNNGTMKESDWEKWLADNKDYLAWSDGEQRLYLCEEAKAAKIPVDAWLAIPEDKRAAWGTLRGGERKDAQRKAQADLTEKRDAERRAFWAGVAVEVWNLIPPEKQEKWDSLPDEERIALVLAAKKKVAGQP